MRTGIKRPNYQVFTFDLSQASPEGGQLISARARYFVFIGAYPQAGGDVQLLTALVDVQLGRNSGDAIPFGVNSKLKIPGGVDELLLSWAGQGNYNAVFLLSDSDPDLGSGIELDSPPATQVVVAGTLNVNETEIDGTAVDVNTGNATAGTQRVVLASNQPTVTVSNPTAVNPLPNNAQPGKIGTSFFATTTVSTQTIVAPASNLNGIVVRNAFVDCSATGGFFGGTAAPTSALTNPPVFWQAGENQMPREVYIPAGQGLYMWCGSVPDASISYDIL